MAIAKNPRRFGDAPRGAELLKKIPEKQKADTSKLIVSPMPNGARVLIESAARAAGDSLRVVMEVHSVHLIKKMVQAGWGYTVALRASVQEELDRGVLAACPAIHAEALSKLGALA